jgi:DNA helicase-2/ATP-dependent DNA helicase PcrA
MKAKEVCRTLLAGQEVLFLSFSRAAVRQVLSQCRQLLTGTERALIEVRTYHAFCIDVLKSHGALLNGKRARVLTPERESLLKFEHKEGWTQERARLAREEGLYSFDLFAPCVAAIFEKAVCVRQLYAAKYPLLVVDEFQDTDDDQWRMVRCLARDTTVFCLADPDQRIFEYRGNVSEHRIAQLREEVAPAEFDFTTENHRSPGSGVLAFADCVLKGRALPSTDDVKQVLYAPGMLSAMAHAVVLWTFSQLTTKRGVKQPNVAVLCRTNGLVAQVSEALGEQHKYGRSTLSPLPHHVLWDPELVAASARVIGSILEWPAAPPWGSVSRTLGLVAHYYRLRNADRPSTGAAGSVIKMTAAAEEIANGQAPKMRAARQLLDAVRGTVFTGDPVADWLQARKVLGDIRAFSEVSKEARLVRLFGATDTLATTLHDIWLATGSYAGAANAVKRVLDEERIVGAEREPRGCVLMNMHKSKGKEFDGVVLVEGAYAGRFFSDREEPAQSRRLLRVAITRARYCVTILRPRGAAPLVSA